MIVSSYKKLEIICYTIYKNLNMCMCKVKHCVLTCSINAVYMIVIYTLGKSGKLWSNIFTVRIGYVDTNLSVYENASDIILEVQLLEGTIAPELGNIIVTVSTDDRTASGWPKSMYTFSVSIIANVWFLHAHIPGADPGLFWGGWLLLWGSAW